MGTAFHAIPRYKPLRFSAGAQTQMGCVFCALPRSEQFRQLGAWREHYPRWAVLLFTSLVLVTRFPRCATRAQSQLFRVSPLGSWSQVVTLLTDVNLPGSQEDVVSNWEPAHSLVEDAVSGAKVAAAPCLLALAVAGLPLCLWGGRALCGSQLALLWYSLNPLFCDHGRGHHEALEPFAGKSFCFFFLSLVFWGFGLLSHISSFTLSSRHSGPVLTLKTNDAAQVPLPNPHLLLEDMSVWATSPLAVVVRCIFCGFFFPPSYVALWDSKTPHRHACERVSCCVETSPSWLPPQEGSPSLNLLSLFVFYILSCLLLKRLGCLSGCLVSSTSVQKLFYGSCSTFKWSFDEFVGEKVVSCPIPLPSWDCPPPVLFFVLFLFHLGIALLQFCFFSL